jgi:cell division protein FtsB
MMSPTYPERALDESPNRKVRRQIDNLKDRITHQSRVIESTKAELMEVNHDQKVHKAQNDELREEVQGLRAQIENLSRTSPAIPCAAVAASMTSGHSDERK